MAIDPPRGRELTAKPKGASRRGVSWLWIGLALSIPIHAILIAVLARIPIASTAYAGDGDSTIEVVFVEGDPLEPDSGSPSGLEQAAPELAVTESPSAGMPTEVFGMPDPTGNADGDAVVSARGAPGIISDFGGGADGGGGNGVGVSFFGVGGRGRKVAYVVDKSGSMGAPLGEAPDPRSPNAPPITRITVAKQELDRSISALPDFASVNIALFDSGVVSFDEDGQFVKCRESSLAKIRQWLREIAPGGGTNPVPAFQLIFSRSERPDLVYFMSDGEIPIDAAEEILRLNRRGPNTVIHCIAFGQAAATAPLRRIAAETGGTFAVVGQGVP